MSPAPALRADGFTVVELLVVAIIALLTSILIPSLQKAQAQAQITQCVANQRGIGLAMRFYLNSFEGFLPGSPNTSGLGPRQNPPDIVLATNAFDYASPLLSFLNLAIPANRAHRQEITRQGPFKCPSNSQLAEPWTGYQAIPDANDFTTTTAASYLTCWNFLLAGDGYAGAELAPGIPYWLYSAGWGEKLPRSYLPKITMIGSPAGKIFLADAARYVDDRGSFSYDIGYDLFGAGSYSGSGAWWVGSREYGQESPAVDYSYRHNDGIAAAFYDGHCAYITKDDSRPACYWYPKGTIITDASEGLGGEPSGYVVP